jgi:hypothetical protein
MGVGKMYNTQNEMFDGGNTLVCHNCGGVNMTEKRLATNKKKGLVYAVFGWIFFAISIVFMPIIFGAVALCMGIITFFERSQVHGAILSFFAASGLILGTLFNFFVTGTMFI